MISTPILCLPGHTAEQAKAFIAFFEKIDTIETAAFNARIQILQREARSYSTGSFERKYITERIAFAHKVQWKAEIDANQKNPLQLIALYQEIREYEKNVHLSAYAKEARHLLISTYHDLVKNSLLSPGFIKELYESMTDLDEEICPIWLKAKVLKKWYRDT